MSFARRVMAILFTVAAAVFLILPAGAAAHAAAAPQAAATQAAAVVEPAERPTAHGPVAPRVKFGTGCIPQQGYCIKFSRSETRTVATGSPAAAITVLGSACGLIPPPGNILCGAGAAIYGPGVAAQAKNALAARLCLGFTNLGGTLPVPVAAVC